MVPVYYTPVLKRLFIVFLSLVSVACSSRVSAPDYKNVAGNYTGSLRAGDVVGLHLMTLNLIQYNQTITGTATYENRSFTVSGVAYRTDVDLTLTEANCPNTVRLDVHTIHPNGGLTVGIHGDTGCGWVSASGLMAR